MQTPRNDPAVAIQESNNQSMSSSAAFNEAASASDHTKQQAKGRWTAEEHATFLESLRSFGKDWYRVEEAIGTRSSA